MTRRARSQGGFMLVEVMVSALILVVGLLGVFMALDANGHTDTNVLRTQVATSEAEKAMEQIKAKSFANLVMDPAHLPTTAADGLATGDISHNPRNPGYWVSGTNLKIAADFNNENGGLLGGTASTGEPFVQSGTSGTGIPGNPYTTFTDGNVSGSVYAFITWVNEKCATDTSTQDAKRVTVAAVLTNTTAVGVTKPVWLSSIVPNLGVTTC